MNFFMYHIVDDYDNIKWNQISYFHYFQFKKKILGVKIGCFNCFICQICQWNISKKWPLISLLDWIQNCNICMINVIHVMMNFWGSIFRWKTCRNQAVLWFTATSPRGWPLQGWTSWVSHPQNFGGCS